MRTILIAEDNVELSDIMSTYLKNAGYQVLAVYDGAEALKFFDKADLVLLDIMLPCVDGYEVCDKIRKHKTVPIIVVSAKVGEYDKEKMFALGADDYMTKPFSFKEMVMRVNAQLRRYYEFNGTSVQSDRKYGDLVVSSEQYEAKIGDKPLQLTTKEFKILDYLTQHENQIMPKQKIIDNVWGVDGYIDENTLAVTIARLREKLIKVGCNHIVTIWGLGYKWQN